MRLNSVGKEYITTVEKTLTMMSKTRKRRRETRTDRVQAVKSRSANSGLLPNKFI
jgi:hypothetical protein